MNTIGVFGGEVNLANLDQSGRSFVNLLLSHRRREQFAYVPKNLHKYLKKLQILGNLCKFLGKVMLTPLDFGFPSC